MSGCATSFRNRASHYNKVLIAAGVEDVYRFSQSSLGDPAFYDENSFSYRVVYCEKSVDGCHEKDQERTNSRGDPEQGLFGE
jgi:hypothetical protein